MKRKIAFVLACIMLLGTVAVSANNGEIRVFLDGELIKFDVPPKILDGRTLVPIRIVAEKLGCQVVWQGEKGSILIRRDGEEITLQINNKEAKRAGKQVLLEVAPTIENGRTLLPLRFVSENFGAKVVWNEADRTITIQKAKDILPASLPVTYKGTTVVSKEASFMAQAVVFSDDVVAVDIFASGAMNFSDVSLCLGYDANKVLPYNKSENKVASFAKTTDANEVEKYVEVNGGFRAFNQGQMFTAIVENTKQTSNYIFINYVRKFGQQDVAILPNQKEKLLTVYFKKQGNVTIDSSAIYFGQVDNAQFASRISYRDCSVSQYGQSSGTHAVIPAVFTFAYPSH